MTLPELLRAGDSAIAIKGQLTKRKNRTLRLFKCQCYRAGGLNLVVAAIVLWNTVYLERAVQALRDSGKNVDDKLLTHLLPLGWEHINLIGDYIWRQSNEVEKGKFRPLWAPGKS